MRDQTRRVPGNVTNDTRHYAPHCPNNRYFPMNLNRTFPTLVSVAALAAALGAQTPAAPPSPFRDLDRYVFSYAHAGSQLKDYIYARSRAAFAAGDRQRDAITTAAGLRQRQDYIRRTIIASLGGLPPLDTPLNARVTGIIEEDGFRIEKIIFESQPHHYVTANLYVPAARPAARTGAVLFLSGHHDTARLHAEYQHVCQTLARAGLIVLAQDPVGQGERLSYFDPATGQNPVGIGTRDHDYAGAQCRLIGDSLARTMLHDALRGIDYLRSRPDVEPTRIGVTGNSGGGTQTSLVMLADPRIAAAAPATFIMSRDSYQRTGQAQDAEQIWPGFTQAGLDHEDILLAMAPKPVCVLAVKSDFFPIEGTRRTVQRCRRFWALSSAGSDLELVEDNSTHFYTPALANAAARFFARHLLGRDVDLAGFAPSTLPVEHLHCTKSGQVRAEFPDAKFVFETNLDRFHAVQAARMALPPAERAARARDWLRAEVSRHREPNPLNPRRIERDRAIGNFSVDIAFWWAQPDLANLGMLIRPRDRSGPPRPVTIAIWEDGTAALSRHTAWIEAECAAGRAVFVVNLSGMGPLKPDPINKGPMAEFYGTWHKLADDLQWLGDSTVALRTHEALRAIEVLAEWPELKHDDVRYYAEDRVGVHARLAAMIAGSSVRCDWERSFRFSDFVRTRSYETANIKTYTLPSVLAYFDFDEQ